LNIPLALTLFRLIVSPLILPLLLVAFLPFDNLFINSLLAIVFLLFGITDFLDGYLARRFGQETRAGKLLDPIADKFLVYSTLVALLAVHKLFFYWVILFIGRELFVMGLRIIALEHQIQVPVSQAGKIKTMLQILCLAFIIFNPYQAYGYTQAPIFNGVETVLLVTALFLSITSAYDYMMQFIRSANLKLF
jgi:CDP-diacylglycerol--glycerol-3-phosphate 3-phosphatidyltransferase